jgi:hypothetical protein
LSRSRELSREVPTTSHFYHLSRILEDSKEAGKFRVDLTSVLGIQ